eukprot:1679807-Rhodomonas_salina.3
MQTEIQVPPPTLRPRPLLSALSVLLVVCAARVLRYLRALLGNAPRGTDSQHHAHPGLRRSVPGPQPANSFRARPGPA